MRLALNGKPFIYCFKLLFNHDITGGWLIPLPLVMSELAAVKPSPLLQRSHGATSAPLLTSDSEAPGPNRPPRKKKRSPSQVTEGGFSVAASSQRQRSFRRGKSVRQVKRAS